MKEEQHQPRPLRVRHGRLRESTKQCIRGVQNCQALPVVTTQHWSKSHGHLESNDSPQSHTYYVLSVRIHRPAPIVS